MATLSEALRADEFGDFQTPVVLARQVCRLLAAEGLLPASVLEPTCGIGNFLLAALDQFPFVTHGIGVEINAAYIDRLDLVLKRRPDAGKVRLIRDSFFQADWPAFIRSLTEPILVLGNPPWVTNADLGALGSSNLPQKTNFQNHKGLDAITGKSNFDISEWMLIRLLELLEGRRATLAMLCKTAVARKVLSHAWKENLSLADAAIRAIDTAGFFNAAVDACLLVCTLDPAARTSRCRVFQHLEDKQPKGVIGYQDGQLLADLTAYNRWKHLGGEEVYKWRSGVKHDCSKVMELRKEGLCYRNGHGELVELEDDYLYPMLKSSELANGTPREPSRWMLVTQRSVGENTNALRVQAPKTWKYLQRHREALDRRASSIYRNRPQFSVFGVGEYSFSPWKVAISGFYKKLHFVPVGTFLEKPIVLDDTSYFVPCRTEQEAFYLASLLSSGPAREFFQAFIFWDAKRPITIELLRRLDLRALAHEIGSPEVLDQFLMEPERPSGQLFLWDSKSA